MPQECAHLNFTSHPAIFFKGSALLLVERDSISPLTQQDWEEETEKLKITFYLPTFFKLAWSKDIYINLLKKGFCAPEGTSKENLSLEQNPQDFTFRLVSDWSKLSTCPWPDWSKFVATTWLLSYGMVELINWFCLFGAIALEAPNQVHTEVEFYFLCS